MNTNRLTSKTVNNAIAALQSGDKKTWFSLFAPDIAVFDDGRKTDLHSFFKKNLEQQERFTRIDTIENNNKDVYGHFHSDPLGNVKTFFRFSVNDEGKISKLEIGQVWY